MALLLDVLHRLVDEGHTVIVVEHHLDLIAEADYVVDIGPEAGHRGGELVVAGTPEEVAEDHISRTAPFLKELLKNAGGDNSKKKESSLCDTPATPKKGERKAKGSRKKKDLG